jgi:hypothetical protein
VAAIYLVTVVQHLDQSRFEKVLVLAPVLFRNDVLRFAVPVDEMVLPWGFETPVFDDRPRWTIAGESKRDHKASIEWTEFINATVGVPR